MIDQKEKETNPIATDRNGRPRKPDWLRVKLPTGHEYAKVRKQFLAEHLYCEANLTGCLIVADQCHHITGKVL
jgi:lipoate synthase